VPGSDNISPRRLKGPDGSSRTLETLYEIAQRTGNSPSPAEAGGLLLDSLVSRMETDKGMVGLADNGGVSLLSVRGMRGTAEARHCAGRETHRPFMLLRERREPFRTWQRVPGANPAREEIAFLGVPVPSPAGRKAFILVDRIYEDSVDPAADIRLLTACAALVARHLPGNLEGPGGVNDREETVPLGRMLQQEIAAWVGPMEVSRRLRSDVFERLMGEVEKIVIAAALEKTGYVQTETARFLGISRNTLAKKMERHGLKRRER
jgi:DNA-binding protein Fis